jgi:hypothetical protein
MLYTSTSFDLSDTKISKESFHAKKFDSPSPVWLPKIKIDAEVQFIAPIIRIQAKNHRSFDKTINKIKNLKAIRVNDITETMSKDLPRTLFRSIVISPRRTSKIFASIDFSQSCEPKSYKRSPKTKNSSPSKIKNPNLDKLLKEIGQSSEGFRNYKQTPPNSVTRPISPWLYQGTSRRFSIFSNLK